MLPFQRFFSMNVSRVSPTNMNQSSVKAALFPASSCFLYAFGSRPCWKVSQIFVLCQFMPEKILMFFSAALTANYKGKGFDYTCVIIT